MYAGTCVQDWFYLLCFVILGSPMISSSCAIPTQVSVFGNNVSLSCPVSSNPLPVIQWFKDGVPISSSLSPSSYSLDDDNMTLLLFTPPPSRSSYTCRAVNSLGNDSSTLILSIEGMSLFMSACLSVANSNSNSNGKCTYVHVMLLLKHKVINLHDHCCIIIKSSN